MKLSSLLLIVLFAFSNCTEQNRSFTEAEIAILPKPNSLVLDEGSFAFKEGQTVYANLETQQIAVKDLQKFISKNTGFQTNIGQSSNASISFFNNEELAPEAYELKVDANNILISANSKAGYFYAVQTLKQLLSIEKSVENKPAKYLIPAVSIYAGANFDLGGFNLMPEIKYSLGGTEQLHIGASAMFTI